MAKTNLASMSVDALLKLREEIAKVLTRKAGQLKDQLSRLEGEAGYKRRDGRIALKGRKVVSIQRSGVLCSVRTRSFHSEQAHHLA
jgi:hypothetical protein